MTRGGRFGAALGAMLVAALTLRVGYIVSQPAVDPAFAHPILDGAYYLAWAHAIAAGSGTPAGAFYLAPLYPYLLASFLRLFGENFALLYGIQAALVLGAAAALATAARRAAGDNAGLAAAALFLLYQPSLFFASCPVGESVALLLIATSVALAGAERAAGAWWGGVAAGVAGLARPNFLPAAALWGLGEVLRRRPWRAALLLGGVALAVAPVAIRNFSASDHWVPVSSNGGITFFHGNGPGALGIYAPARGFSAGVATQRDEATRRARALTGRELDAVEADRWWGREALRVRLDEPAGTMVLLGRRFLLTLDNHEHSVDYAPALDANPWRRAAPVPFALILGLAAAGLVLTGARGTGGWPVWGGIAATAATPLLFYVSSRYRLPMAALLSVPAGVGLVAIFDPAAPRSRRRLAAAILLGVLLAAVSVSVPFADLRTAEKAAALANRAGSWKQSGELTAAERDVREAIALDPTLASARIQLGIILTAAGRLDEAEASYREALRLDPVNAIAAENLAGQLIQRGRELEAIALLRPVLAADAGAAGCWNNLIVALVSSGDLAGARIEAERAERSGVTIDPELLSTLGTSP